MTKVLQPHSSFRCLTVALAVALTTLLAAAAHAQITTLQCPQTTAALYSRIRSVPLDPQRVYHIRDASIDRPSLHIDLDDGTLAFTEDICGRITGAFFEGEGEILMRPPNRVERGSLALFTGMAILEEQFTQGYLRFNDDTAAKLQPSLTSAPAAEEFIAEWSDASRTLAEFDALRLLIDFSHFLPESNGSRPDQKFQPLLHAHLLGKKLGAFEVFSDAAAAESIWAGQPRLKDELLFFDIWTSFASAATANSTPGNASTAAAATGPSNDVSITAFQIRAAVQPPTVLKAATEVNLRIRNGGERTLLFELSRYLKVDAVEADGRAVDFLQNPGIEGMHAQRKGNDVIAVVFPKSLTAGQELKLRFTYAGEVLAEAGSGLLYVGDRGIWYPNFGLSPAQFDMEFHYPSNWTLVATGKQTSRGKNNNDETDAGPDKVSHWISERPIPVAGFNLGQYVRAEAKAAGIVVEAYGTKGVEKSFPKGSSAPVEQQPVFPGRPRSGLGLPPMVIVPPAPSPAHDAQAVADKAAKAIGNFSQWFGPYPYGSLALTQMPGRLSQGWPGLVFLSSYAFLSPQEQADLHLDALTRALDSQVLVHETAHQWWGDLVLWKTYRDQWISEGLANYAALLTLEQKDPQQFRELLEKYRRDLMATNKDGERLRDAGPVTLGQRLDSSHFPAGYEAISYERGTWLFHMLRSMLHDASLAHGSEFGSHSRKARTGSAPNPDELFFRVLRKTRDRYAGKTISTQELVQAFEEELPRPLWYESRRKLDWFLHGWIDGTSIPELDTRDVHFTEKNGVTTVTGVIVQKDVPEDLVTAIPVYALAANNAQVYLGQVLADGPETPFHLTAPAQAHRVVLDPEQTILSATK